MNFAIIFVLSTCCFLSIKCDVSVVWKPNIFSEIFENNTKAISNHFQEQGRAFSNAVNIYVKDAKIQTDSMAKEFKDIWKTSGDELNFTLQNYATLSDMGSQLKDSVLNIKNYDYSEYIPDMYLDTVHLIVKNGYEAESHIVQTEDGYLLTLHRIPHAKGAPLGTSGRQAVFLQHGLLSSSADFVTSGVSNGLAYILADSGYDVWMGNFRGNTYSRVHINMSIKDPAFWNFTWHEAGVYDLPAMIDYVNKIKGNEEDLLYIGHSMGNTALYVLLSTRLEYNKKIKAAFSMAPVAYMETLQSPLRYLAPLANSVEWIAEFFGAGEFLPQSAITKWLARTCESNHYEQKVCQNSLFILAGYDEKQFDKDTFPIILSHSPAGASTKTVVHYAQEIRDSGKFQHFDYGETRNVKIYGQKTPPEYSVESITLPISLFTANNDWLVGNLDAQKLYERLKNPTEIYKIPFEEFNHFDFLFARDVRTLVYDKLLDSMGKFKIENNIHWSFKPFFRFNWNKNSV